MGFEPTRLQTRPHPPLPLILRKVFPSLRLGLDWVCDETGL